METLSQDPGQEQKLNEHELNTAVFLQSIGNQFVQGEVELSSIIYWADWLFDSEEEKQKYYSNLGITFEP